jgi:hypothetical protein
MFNTKKIMDVIDFRTEATRNADENNLSFRGVKPVPKPFQPYFRFGGSETGAVQCPEYNTKVAQTMNGIGQPGNVVFESTRPMKKRGE